jgi:hypothetical protein
MKKQLINWILKHIKIIKAYQNYKGLIKCPYSKNSKESTEWYKGLSEGTEDYINTHLY